MSLGSWFDVKHWFGKRGTEVYDMGEWEVQNIGNLVVPEKLTNKNAFLLANSVSEIYFPIDFYADRISKLRFFIADKEGNEVEKTELNRFINEINPIWGFNDLVYNYVFSLLSDGNAINYLSVPSSYKNRSVNNISRWDILQPNLVDIEEYDNVSVLDIKGMSDLIKKVKYYEQSSRYSDLETKNVIVHNVGQKRQPNSRVKAEGMLWKANKSIDTLMAVYSARYNVYANNGAGGYLARKTTTGGASQLESAMMDGSKKQEILDDINDRNGLTGKRNMWGISGIPIEFVRTLATINELMPFEETLESSIKISAAFQIPAVLIPRKDQSTYDNQASSERSVWENGLLSMAKTVTSNLTKMFALDKVGYSIGFDSSNVSALTTNKKEVEELNKSMLENINLMKTMNPNLDVSKLVQQIYDSYGTE